MIGPRPYRPGNPFAEKAYRPGNPFADPAPVRIGRPAGDEHAANAPKPLTLGQGVRAGVRTGLGLFTQMLTGVPAPTLSDALDRARGTVSGVDVQERMLTSAVPFGDYLAAAGRYVTDRVTGPTGALRMPTDGARSLTDVIAGKRGGFAGALDAVRADQARLPSGIGTAADLAGAIVGGAALPAPKAAPGLLGLAKDVGYGTVLGSAYAAGEAPEGEMLSRGVEGAVVGGVGTAAISGLVRGGGALARRFRSAPPASPVAPAAAGNAPVGARNRYAELLERAKATTRDLPPAPPEVAAQVEAALPEESVDDVVEAATTPAARRGNPANWRRGKPMEEQSTEAVLTRLQRNLDAMQNDRISPAQWSNENNWGEMVSPSGGGLGGYILQKASERTEQYLAELARRGIDTDAAYAMLDDLAERTAIGAEDAVRAPMRPRSGSPMTGDVPFSPLRDRSGRIGPLYHGSPHKFDRFDISKMGTGEGNQAYGPGHYLAERESTGRYYKEALAAKGTTLTPEARRAIEAYDNLGFDNPQQAASAIFGHDDWAQRWIVEDDASREAIDAWRKRAIEARRGSLYTVELPSANADDFLDWDKPLSQQSPRVREALRRANPDAFAKMDGNAGYSGAGEMTGGQFFESAIAGDRYGHRQAAAKLQEAGVRGHRYLDGVSRGNADAYEATERLIAKMEAGGHTERAAELRAKLATMVRPSRNYVVYADDDINILNREGVSGLQLMSGITGSGIGGTGGAMVGGNLGGRIGATPEERERNARTGRLLGGGVGALLGFRGGMGTAAALEGVGRSRAGIALAPGATSAAVRGDEALVSLMEKRGVSPDEIERTLRLRRSIGGADRTTLADLDESLRGAARDVSANPGGQGLKVTMRDRAQQVGRDAMANVRRLLNVPEHADIPAYQAEIIQRAQQTIGPEFEKAFTASPVVNTPELQALLERPAIAKAFRLFAENEANMGRTVPDLAKGADLRTLARLKESLDAYLFTAERGGDAALGIPRLQSKSAGWRAVNEARQALLDFADTQYGPAGQAYKALRGQYAGEFDLKRAAGLGESILNPKVSPSVYGRRVGTMRPEEQESFRVGVARAVEKRLNRFIKASTDAERIQIQQEALGRLKAALGDDPLFAQIQQAFEVAREQQLTNTTILNRSTTADALLGNRQLGSIWQAIRRPGQAVVELMAKAGMRRYEEAEARRMARQLGVSGAELDQVLADVRRLWNQRQGIRAAAAGSGRAATAAGAGLAGRRP